MTIWAAGYTEKVDMREAAQEKLGELLAAAEAACEVLLSELAAGLLHALPGARTPRALIRGLAAFDTPPPPTATAAAISTAAAMPIVG
eukprot:SM000106S13980  [mRNA]  locus=s106:344291:344625:+ [translate_table: standard]